VPLAIGLALTLTPLAALAMGQSAPIVVGCMGMAAIVLTKRVLTNRIAVPEDLDWKDVLLNRLLFDRDVRDRDAWLRRLPQDQERPIEKRSH
jgi:hypothetical protein